MLCSNPFVRDKSGRLMKAALLSHDAFKSEDLRREMMLGAMTFPCGQCLACRINKRRVWTHRLMLEGFCHEDSVFLTLTYAPEHLPEGGQLCKRHVQLWLKRVRRALEPRRIRYYLAGEYGEKYGRPHYHAILFGVRQSEAQLCASLWPYGLVDKGDGNRLTYQYVAGYVTKKYVKKSDGIQREFALMSRKPGIGYPALEKVMQLMDNPQFVKLIHLQKDVPHGLRHGEKFWPFGQYLTNKLREMMDSGYTPDTFYSDLRQKYIECAASGQQFFERMQDENRQRLRDLYTRERLFGQRRKYHGPTS